jgi:hypothetical protein
MDSPIVQGFEIDRGMRPLRRMRARKHHLQALRFAGPESHQFPSNRPVASILAILSRTRASGDNKSLNVHRSYVQSTQSCRLVENCSPL